MNNSLFAIELYRGNATYCTDYDDTWGYLFWIWPDPTQERVGLGTYVDPPRLSPDFFLHSGGKGSAHTTQTSLYHSDFCMQKLRVSKY